MASIGGNASTGRAPSWLGRSLQPRFVAELPEHLRDHPAFRQAAAHSRRVRFWRRTIPLLAVATMAFLAARTITGFLAIPDVADDSVGLQGRKIVMEKPRLSGFKRDGRSYELNAATATQDIKTPNVVALDALKARLQTGNEGWADLAGARGVYDSKGEKLEVDGGVSVRTETGMDARLKDAQIDFRSGMIVTDKPVEVKTNQGDVNADRMQVHENGRKLVFEGRVRSVFVNPGPDSGSSRPEPARQEKTRQEPGATPAGKDP
jgi:lipopolysaccharide export system protein LptC